jgi:DNA-binding transcriptional MerR regulator
MRIPLCETVGVVNGTLLSSADVAARCGVTPRVLDYWVRRGAVQPTQPPAGYGSRTGYSPGDVARLEAIATVRDDLWQLGLDLPVGLVRRLWDALEAADVAILGDRSVLITVAVETAA